MKEILAYLIDEESSPTRVDNDNDKDKDKETNRKEKEKDKDKEGQKVSTNALMYTRIQTKIDFYNEFDNYDYIIVYNQYLDDNIKNGNLIADESHIYNYYYEIASKFYQKHFNFLKKFKPLKVKKLEVCKFYENQKWKLLGTYGYIFRQLLSKYILIQVDYDTYPFDDGTSEINENDTLINGNYFIDEYAKKFLNKNPLIMDDKLDEFMMYLYQKYNIEHFDSNTDLNIHSNLYKKLDTEYYSLIKRSVYDYIVIQYKQSEYYNNDSKYWYFYTKNKLTDYNYKVEYYKSFYFNRLIKIRSRRYTSLYDFYDGYDLYKKYTSNKQLNIMENKMNALLDLNVWSLHMNWQFMYFNQYLKHSRAPQRVGKGTQYLFNRWSLYYPFMYKPYLQQPDQYLHLIEGSHVAKGYKVNDSVSYTHNVQQYITADRMLKRCHNCTSPHFMLNYKNHISTNLCDSNLYFDGLANIQQTVRYEVPLRDICKSKNKCYIQNVRAIEYITDAADAISDNDKYLAPAFVYDKALYDGLFYSKYFQYDSSKMNSNFYDQRLYYKEEQEEEEKHYQYKYQKEYVDVALSKKLTKNVLKDYLNIVYYTGLRKSHWNYELETQEIAAFGDQIENGKDIIILRNKLYDFIPLYTNFLSIRDTNYSGELHKNFTQTHLTSNNFLLYNYHNQDYAMYYWYYWRNMRKKLNYVNSSNVERPLFDENSLYDYKYNFMNDSAKYQIQVSYFQNYRFISYIVKTSADYIYAIKNKNPNSDSLVYYSRRKPDEYVLDFEFLCRMQDIVAATFLDECSMSPLGLTVFNIANKINDPTNPLMYYEQFDELLSYTEKRVFERIVRRVKDFGEESTRNDVPTLLNYFYKGEVKLIKKNIDLHMKRNKYVYWMFNDDFDSENQGKMQQAKKEYQQKKEEADKQDLDQNQIKKEYDEYMGTLKSFYKQKYMAHFVERKTLYENGKIKPDKLSNLDKEVLFVVDDLQFDKPVLKAKTCKEGSAIEHTDCLKGMLIDNGLGLDNKPALKKLKSFYLAFKFAYEWFVVCGEGLLVDDIKPKCSAFDSSCRQCDVVDLTLQWEALTMIYTTNDVFTRWNYNAMGTNIHSVNEYVCDYDKLSYINNAIYIEHIKESN